MESSFTAVTWTGATGWASASCFLEQAVSTARHSAIAEIRAAVVAGHARPVLQISLSISRKSPSKSAIRSKTSEKIGDCPPVLSRDGNGAVLVVAQGHAGFWRGPAAFRRLG